MKFSDIERLVSLDIEATGLNPATDRIVQIAAVRYERGEPIAPLLHLVNPGQPIPAETTEIHGITDADVEGKPLFCEIAEELHEYIAGCVLLGFNLLNFDLPLLWEEFYRAGVTWGWSGHDIIDAGNIFKKKEPRTLEAALMFYCGRPLVGAHDALADAAATADVFRGQIERYADMAAATAAKEIADIGLFEKRFDLAGKIVANKDGDPVYGFGKVKGVRVLDDPGFGRWMLGRDFPTETKIAVRRILEADNQGQPDQEPLL